MTEPVTRIRAHRALLDIGIAEIWSHRELLYFLVWRDIKVRYKQTAFGAAWAVLQPLLLAVVFTVVVGRLLDAPSGGVPYPVFVYAGLVPWTLFAQGLIAASNSLVDTPNLVSKIYFPRLIMPVAASASYLVDYVVASVVLFVIMIVSGVPITSRVLVLPLLALSALTVSLSVGIWLSAVNVKYRDVRHALPFFVQLWLFATPVAYPTTLIPDRWRVLVGVNPMAGVVEATRWALFGTAPPSTVATASFVSALMLFAGGLMYFRRADLAFADWV